MKNILFLITLFITVVLSACFDDKGNYDYHEINELQITGLPEELQVKYRNVDTLRATPVIEATADDGSMPDRYSFKWEAVSELKAGETQTTSYLIGEEENLSYFVELPDGEYNVNCLVKDTITRVTWKGTFKLRVTTQLNEGWLVLSDVNGNARLDLISMSAKEDMVVRDILQDAPELKGPKKINSVYQMYYNQWGTDLRFYIVTETATAALDVATYQWDEANEIRYEMLEYPADFSATNRTAGMGWELLVSDKYVFGGTTFGQEVLFGVPINYLTGDNGNYFNVASAVGVNTSSTAMYNDIILYDTSNKRFVKLATGGMRNCELMSVKESLFSWETGKDFVWMENSLYDGGTTYAILQDTEAPYTRYLYVMGMPSFGAGGAQKKFIELDGYPEIENATCFAVHPNNPWVFYAVGNTVYYFDLEGHKAEPIHLDSETITMLKFNLFRGINSAYDPVCNALQRKLIVGSVKSGGELNGVVHTYDLPTVIGDDFVESTMHSGFGTPVDVTYREK